ncbi:MAG: hypothetical protein IJX18_02125 [Clostridia bacterium]|nr:hypothetical protein [Clostridia bacterium]
MKPLVKKCTCSLIALLAVCSCAFAAPNTTPKVATVAASAATSTAERRYYDETSVSPRAITETIYYARKEQTYTLFDYCVPYYQNNNTSLTNACGAVAGAIVVGYYDKYFEDLIPNYTAYYTSGRYRGVDSTYVPALIQDLYTRMRTNVDDVGVSESDCINGLTSYVQSKGHSITYTSAKSGSGFNHTLCDNAIATGKPILLFCENVSLYGVGESDGYDYWSQSITSGAHIAVAFGYLTINYYDANDALIRTDHHIEIATGWPGNNKCGYLNANDSSWLNSAYIVNIT